ALWVLAVLANITAIHRILFTRRITAEKAAPGTRRRRTPTEVLAVLVSVALVAGATVVAAEPVAPETVQRWTRAVEAYQQGVVAPLVTELGSEAALASPVADHARYLIADALERRGDLAGARAMAVSVADRAP